MAIPRYTRYVVVDDSSPELEYGGAWFDVRGSRVDTSLIGGLWGTPYSSTLHGTNSSGSVNFNFSGPAVRVIGSNPIRNVSGVTISDLEWSCSVDGVNINSTFPSTRQYPGNNWQFCSSDSLTDGPHIITVNATATNNQTFWFDRIEYAPSSSVPLGNKSILLTWNDPAMQFGTGWVHYVTDRNNSAFAFNFYGVSLAWYGNIFDGNSTTSIWSVDDNPTRYFTVQGVSNETYSTFYQKIFETDKYSMGWHRLRVVYYSTDNTSADLLLHYLIVQNGTELGPSSSSFLTAPTSSSGPISNTNTSDTNKGAIIGGGIGGTACLLIAFLVFFFIYRRRRNAEVMVEVDVPFVGEPQLSHNTIAVFPPDYNRPGFASSSKTGLLVADTLRPASSHQEEHHPAQNESQKNSRSTPDIGVSNSNGQEVGPSGLTVHRGSGADLIHQELPGTMPEELPPAYTPG